MIKYVMFNLAKKVVLTLGSAPQKKISAASLGAAGEGDSGDKSKDGEGGGGGGGGGCLIQ